MLNEALIVKVPLVPNIWLTFYGDIEVYFLYGLVVSTQYVCSKLDVCLPPVGLETDTPVWHCWHVVFRPRTSLRIDPYRIALDVT
jgi:hypothetical protein